MDIYPRHMCTSIMCRVFLLAICTVAVGDVRLLRDHQTEGERTAACEQ